MPLTLTDIYYILSIIPLWIISGVNSQCATYNSYCLTGLLPTDYASFIAAYYEYRGTDEGCKYFENTQLPDDFGKNVYLHWDTGLNKWYIGESLYSTEYWAYCTYSLLDSCTSGRWTRYDGSSSATDYSMSIVPCSYDNTQCLAQYNNTFAKNKHNDKDFCIRNTHHRTINYQISDSFSVSGCSEEKPYYTSNSNSGVSSYEGSVLTLSWDNEMSVWHMHYAADIVAWGPVAYCTFNDIKTCTNNWYIWDGEDTTKDSAVISGLCNTCTDTKYDSFCVYGGIGRDQFELMVGMYEPDACVELMNSYNHTQYDDYYTDNLTHGGNLTLHYYCEGNSWRIDVDYDRNISYAICDEIDDIMECSGNWTVYDPVEDAWNVQESIQSGACDVIYQQCFEVIEEYLCITEDDNDAAVVNNENYYSFIAGEFKYLECDEDGFPIYVRHRDNNGNYLNETWYNYSMVTYDSTLNVFSVHKHNKTLKASQDGHWLYCRALLIELCDTFMNIYDASSDEWVVSPSIRLSKQKCNYPKDEASLLDTITENWIYILIGFGMLLLCCLCCLYFVCRKKNKKEQLAPANYGNAHMANTPTPTRQAQYRANNNNYNNNINYNNNEHNYNMSHEMGPSSIARPVQFIPVQPIPVKPVETLQHPAKQSISYRKQQVTSKQSISHKEAAPPPPYDPNYDNQNTTTKYSGTMKMENANHANNQNEGQPFGRVTFGENDVALDVLVNENENDNNNENGSAIINWKRNDIVEWINNIGLTQQWKETAVNAIKNGQYDGHDMMQIKSGKDFAKIFGIQNPMLCSRLWKELKKMN